MREFFKFLIRFFHGWRRKIGLLTLLMALATVGVWVRSEGSGYGVVRFTDSSGCIISLTDSTLIFAVSENLSPRDDQGSDSLAIMILYYYLDEIGLYTSTGGDGITPLRSNFQTGLFVISKDAFHSNGFILPYWSITILLMLTSLWLLLSKSPKSNRKKTAEPTAYEGT